MKYIVLILSFAFIGCSDVSDNKIITPIENYENSIKEDNITNELILNKKPEIEKKLSFNSFHIQNIINAKNVNTIKTLNNKDNILFQIENPFMVNNEIFNPKLNCFLHGTAKKALDYRMDIHFNEIKCQTTKGLISESIEGWGIGSDGIPGVISRPIFNKNNNLQYLEIKKGRNNQILFLNPPKINK